MGVPGGFGPKPHWGMRLVAKAMTLQGLKQTNQRMLGYADQPKRGGMGQWLGPHGPSGHYGGLDGWWVTLVVTKRSPKPISTVTKRYYEKLNFEEEKSFH